MGAPRVPRPILFGHRGAPAELPENTLASFARALEHGVDALETDVHHSKDGAVVVFHDATGHRTAAQSERIADVSLAELRAWDLGHGERIVTFDELLARFPGVPINVDIKPPDVARARDFVRALKRSGDATRVRIASFSDDVVHAARALDHAGGTALTRRETALLWGVPGRLGRVALRALLGGCDVRAQVPRRYRRAHLDTDRFLAQASELGIPVDYWVVNDVDEARTLLQRGAAGIMTDNPGVVRAAFARDAQTDPG